jgi:hypothetical protein
MRRHSVIFGIMLMLCATSPSAIAAETSSSVVGTWRVKSFTNLTVGTNEVSRLYGENPNGYIQYSPGGHMIVFLQEGNPAKPAGAPYTDAERAAIHRGIFGAYAGTYSVEGNKVTHHIQASWRPDWIGDNQVRYVEINGRNLTIKTAPLISNRTGKQSVNTLTFERVE